MGNLWIKFCFVSLPQSYHHNKPILFAEVILRQNRMSIAIFIFESTNRHNTLLYITTQSKTPFVISSLVLSWSVWHFLFPGSFLNLGTSFVGSLDYTPDIYCSTYYYHHSTTNPTTTTIFFPRLVF